MLPFAGADVHKRQLMDDDARERHMNDTHERFTKIYGGEGSAMFEGARRLVAELCAKHPTLKSFLEESGAGASLGVISGLANEAKVSRVKAYSCRSGRQRTARARGVRIVESRNDL